MFTLEKIRERVYHIKHSSSRELCMMFLRYSEFYESINDSLREKSFFLVEQMGIYTREMNKNSSWTYTDDWGGFNIPVNVIKNVHDKGIPDHNFYDDLMKGIYGFIKVDSLGKDAYLIGTASKSKKSNSAYLKHELTHAMFYIDVEYRTLVLNEINDLNVKTIQKLVNCMKDQGYPKKVAFDEINAYITTGEDGHFKSVTRLKEIKKLRKNLISLHKERFEKWLNS